MATSHNQFLYEYLKEAHLYQLERVDKIRERISFISGYLLVLGSGIGSLLWNYTMTFKDHPRRDAAFITAIALACLLFVVAAVLGAICLLRGYLYASIKTAKEVLEHSIEWEKYNENPRVANKADIEEQLKLQLRKAYATAATENLELNSKRGTQILWAMRCAFIASVILVIPATCLIYSKYKDHAPVPPLRVEIVKPA